MGLYQNINDAMVENYVRLGTKINEVSEKARENYDKAITAGLILSTGAYYGNMKYDFAQDIGLQGEAYSWTIGRMPELFGAAVAMRGIDYFLEKSGMDDDFERHFLAGSMVIASMALYEIIKKPLDPQGHWDILAGLGGVMASKWKANSDKRKEQNLESKLPVENL